LENSTDILRKIYDFVGPVPAKYVDKQLDNFIKQIFDHDLKSIDVIVLDLANFKPDQVKKIKEVLGKVKREIIILE
jgi:hypothetical protein